MIPHIWQPRSERQQINVRVNKSVWLEFKKRCRALNVRYEADLLDYILKKALFPPAKLYKVISADMVQQFDFIRHLRERADAEERIEEENAQQELIITN